MITPESATADATAAATINAPNESTPPRESRSRANAVLVLAGVLGAVCIWAALRYDVPPPVAPAHAVGLDVTGPGSVALAPNAPQWKVLKIGKAEPARAGWTDPVPGRVRIDDRQSSKVGVPLAGRVSEVMVDVGRVVHAGEPLFRVSSPDLAELRAQERKAEVDLEAARTALERVTAMVQGHAVAAKEELFAAQALKQAELGKQLAVSKLKSLHVTAAGDEVTDDFVVTSPRDGVIVEKNLVAHQEVSPDTSSSLVIVADLSSVWVVADLFEADAVDVREGAVAEVSLARGTTGPIRGSVDAVSAIVDPNRHTVPIRVTVPNQSGALRPNAFAEVRFAVRAIENAVRIPASAIVSDGAKQHVYVWDDERNFTRRDVEVAGSSGGAVTVIDGLRAGESILIDGGILLDNQIQLGS